MTEDTSDYTVVDLEKCVPRKREALYTVGFNKILQNDNLEFGDYFTRYCR